MAYRNHERLVASARPTSDLGFLIIGFIFVELAFILGFGTIYGIVSALSPDQDTVLLGDTAGIMLLELFAFIFLGVAVVLVVELRHNRDFLSLIGNPFDVVYDFRVTIIALCIVLSLLEVSFLISNSENIEEVRNFAGWLVLLPISLLALLIQTGSEELFYRGYIQQQLAARFNQPWVWLIVPNILFAWGHYSINQDYTSNMQTLIWTFTFGVIASDLTARAGNLGPAVALHLANNFVAIALYGEKCAPSTGLALILFKPETAEEIEKQINGPIFSASLIYQLVFLVILWLAARNALRR